MRRAKVPSHATTSKPGYFVCPACGSGELLPRGSNLARCGSCGCAFDDAIVGTLKQIVALPDALGEHACEECDHPEMRHLPDGVFHCPACGSEVLPIFWVPLLVFMSRLQRIEAERVLKKGVWGIGGHRDHSLNEVRGGN